MAQMFQTLHRTMGPQETLKLQCDGCDRRTTWTYAQAVAHCGPDATPSDIRRRLKCQGCGAEARARIWI